MCEYFRCLNTIAFVTVAEHGGCSRRPRLVVDNTVGMMENLSYLVKFTYYFFLFLFSHLLFPSFTMISMTYWVFAKSYCNNFSSNPQIKLRLLGLTVQSLGDALNANKLRWLGLVLWTERLRLFTLFSETGNGFKLPSGSKTLIVSSNSS